MKRFITKKLLEWKQSSFRKPLIIKGAHQVGKTYALLDFAKNYYDNYVYVNFDKDKGIANFFEETKDPKRILEQLSISSGQKIEPGKTLIIFDEIQECTNALNSLKYFCEEANEYHIACAGSLLGIRLAKTSFPVGKVNFLKMYPMTFSEFLLADNQEELVNFMESIRSVDTPTSLFHSILVEKLKAYYIIGGMPEAVYSWVNNKDLNDVNRILDEILTAYEEDFSKHTDVNEANKISLVWNCIPSQLARENKKFIYQLVKEGARAREYENALIWLENANLTTRCYLAKKASLPLKAYIDLSSYKIYMNDIGLLRKLSGLEGSIITEGDRLIEEFKGEYTENYVANALTQLIDQEPNYYTFDRYEIDFMIQNNNRIIPIEVKSDKSTNNISLTKYNSNNNNEYSYRFSLNGLKRDGKIINIPLYLIEYINNIHF